MKHRSLASILLFLTLAVGELAAGKLNIVFILADDLGWGELGCYGQQRIPTPNVDRLAAQGMRFAQHYSGAPVCAPSRCVLMTGKHLGHAEVRGNLQAQVRFPEFDEGQYPLSAQAVTLAQVFQKAGYATGAIGKWGLGPVDSTGDPNRKGFDLFFGYNCQAVAHSFYPPHLWRNAEKIAINATPIPGHATQPEGEVRLDDWTGETYAPKLMIAEAEKFIAANAAQRRARRLNRAGTARSQREDARRCGIDRSLRTAFRSSTSGGAAWAWFPAQSGRGAMEGAGHLGDQPG